MKQSDVEFYLDIAKLAASRSHAIRLKVGGVICNAEGDIIATGYNGTVRGMDNSCEDKVYSLLSSDDLSEYPYEDKEGRYKLVTKSDTIHSEMNILAHAARRGISINGGSIFLTHSPCAHCTAMLIQSGVKDIYFLEKFRTFNEVTRKYGHKINFMQWIA